MRPDENGAKVGLDDFFAAGHDTVDLLALARSEITPLAGTVDALPYQATDSGLIWHKPTRDGEMAVQLTNFTASIVGEIALDDGVDPQRQFEIEATLKGRKRRFSVPVAQFGGMSWAMERLGAGAIVQPGLSTRDHARAAIQFLSGDVPERSIYTHAGWRLHDDQWVYLHSDGAIGPDGATPDVEVALPDALSHVRLLVASDGQEQVEAVRASLAILDVCPDPISFPGYASIWRAVLSEADLSIHVSGPTGAGKSQFAALLQQHFGADMDAHHLPGAWSSTGNALEGLAFAAKDMLLVIDDFVPTGNSADVQRAHREADRIFRGQGNMAGRQRMRPDGTLRPPRPPRGLIVSTGEEIPRGQSLRARVLVVELGPSDLDWTRLTSCQKDAASGLYAQALAGFVRWLAARYETLRRTLRASIDELRQQAAASGSHRRTPEIIANLALGLRLFLNYAAEIGAITASEADAFYERGWGALGKAAKAQSLHQVEQEPTRRFLELLAAAISRGTAHVASRDGSAPPDSAAWGWRDGDPRGPRIGWVDGEQLFLECDSAYAAAQDVGREVGDALTITPQTLRRRLNEKQLLVSTDVPRQTLTIRRSFEGRERHVLHLRVTSLFPATEPDKPDITLRRPSHRRGEPPVVSAGSSGFVVNPTSAPRATAHTTTVSSPGMPTVKGADPSADTDNVGFVGFPSSSEIHGASNDSHLSGGGQNLTPDPTVNPTNEQSGREVFDL
ncbi:MAG: hypothetical protein U0822_22130 [Anaerolineae bacterium]